ncbi:MAG: lipopolysaccharide biosynthesis protein [Terracidiphilus sp.]
MARTLQSRIVSGTMVLLTGSGLATILSLAYNIVIGWYLGPKSFGHATVVYSLLVLLSAVSFAFQIVAAKVVAQQPSAEAKAEAYRCFHRSAIGCGISVALVLLLFRQGITDYLNLPDSSLIAMLAVAAGFYIPLGARRGYDQGSYRFHRLAMSLVIEGAVRLGGSYGLVVAGYGVQGVVAANAVAMAVSYFAMTQRLPARAPNPLRFWEGTREIGQALLFYSGQMIINNCDLVVVKHIFPAREAGLYAAVGLVGRVIFVLSAAVVNSTFPIVAGTRAEERKDLRLIATPLLLVLGIGSLVVLAMWIAPPSLWTTLLGPGFQIAGKYDVPYLSALYALKTVVYSISAVVITFEMAHKIANTSWIQLFFSGMLIAGIYQFHSSLHQVILVQLAVLSALFVVVAITFLIDALAASKILQPAPNCCPVSLLRPVTENEAIAEFLNSDLNHPDFRDLDKAHGLTPEPNQRHVDAIAKRHALLLAKRRSLWDELPSKTEWHEVKVNEDALDLIRVFPRSEWRKLARGNYSVVRVTEGLRTRQHTLDDRFLSKIATLGEQLAQGDGEFGTVILLGINEHGPLTVLDGNHRLVASLLSSPAGLSKLRFMCGFSPRMTECCWYKTNPATLMRYGKHILARAVRDPRAELERIFGDYRELTENSVEPRKLGGAPSGSLTRLAESNDVQP